MQTQGKTFFHDVCSEIIHGPAYSSGLYNNQNKEVPAAVDEKDDEDNSESASNECCCAKKI